MEGERTIYVCMAPSFFASRLFNPGEMISSKRSPGPNWRLFDEAKGDRITGKGVATNPLDDFAQD
jgi:hypothetical protein